MPFVLLGNVSGQCFWTKSSSESEEISTSEEQAQIMGSAKKSAPSNSIPKLPTRKPNRGWRIKPLTAAAEAANRFRADWGNGTRKQLGELAEMMFMVRASIRGLVVAKPYGETQRYDFLVDSGKRTWRVQVKSSSCTRCRAFTVNAYWKTTRKHLPYLPSQVDFLAIAILGTESWYLIPIRALAGRLMVRVYPFGGDSRGSRRFEKYRDAWHLLQPDKEIGKKELRPTGKGTASSRGCIAK
ncbi:MAG: group I intron-associated PD-(D/E)XK endonuclease [Candidatus Sulfotelmatobacter sp.]